MPDKKITLHPKNEDGQLLQNTNIYPKTTIDQVYSEDGSTPYHDNSFQKPMSAGEGISIENDVISLDSENIAFKTMLLNLLYPVGAHYISDRLGAGGKCPIETTLGGSWERIKQKFLYGAGDSADTIGTTGGNSSISLTVNHLPSHCHHVDGSVTTKEYGYEIIGSASDGDANSNGYFYNYNKHSGSENCIDISLGNATTWTFGGQGSSPNRRYNKIDITHKAQAMSFSVDTSYYGNGAAFSIMPPYLCVYIWKRTA